MARRIPVLGTFFNVFLGAGTSYRESVAGDAVLDARALRNLALDLLGRPPFEAEWRRWATLPRTQVQAEIKASADHRKQGAERSLVRSLYVDLADRLPSAEEAEALGAALAAAGVAPAARMLLDTGKLVLRPRQELPDTGAWVRTQFLRLLGRAASEAEVLEYARLLDEPGARLETALCAIVASPEYDRSAPS